MIYRRLTAALTLLVAAGVSLLPGCGGGGPTTYRVAGKVVAGGAPLKLSDKGVLQVRFLDVDDKDGQSPYPTIVDKEGAFVVTGRDGKGLPTGLYRVAVEIFDPYQAGAKDKLKGRFSNKQTTLREEVTGVKDNIVLDVGKL